MVDVGDLAPDFELKDQNETPIKLSSLRGKRVLLAFFPFAFSPVCTDEMGCFNTDLKQFEAQGLTILGISVDSTWSNAAFAQKLDLKFSVLSDFSKEVSKEYGVLREEGFSERAYFTIDESGVISHKHVMDSPGSKLDNVQLLQ